MDDISQMNKYTKLGNALVEIPALRERQMPPRAGLLGLRFEQGIDQRRLTKAKMRGGHGAGTGSGGPRATPMRRSL